MTAQVPAAPLDARLAAAVGAEVADALASWQAVTGRRLTLVHSLAEGYTDAAVLLALVDGADEPARKIIVKVIVTKADAGEPASHQAALASGPAGFADDHLVSQAYAPYEHPCGTVMFQDVAGGSVQTYRPLSALSGSADMAEALPVVARSAALDWNASDSVLDCSVAGFMREHVRAKLDDGGSLRTWLNEELGLPAEADGVVFSEDEARRVLVNPAVLCDPDSVLGGERLTALVGNAHGDLHVGNVIIPFTPLAAPSRYRLIDLSAYSDSAPLTRDPVNLLLSEVSRVLPSLRAPARRALLEVLVDGRDAFVPAELATLRDAARGVLMGGPESVRARGLADEWREQQTLSLAGVAMAFASRKLFDTAERTWFFELAARAADTFAHGRRAAGPTKPAEVGVPLDARTRAARAVCEAVVEACDGFGGTVASAVLVPAGAVNAAAAATLALAGWDLVIEFDPQTDASGAYAAAHAAADGTHRLVRPGQLPTFASGSTTWFAAAGLAAPAQPATQTNHRRWRGSTLPHVRGALTALAEAHSGPVLLAVLGDPDDAARAVADAAVDVVGDRLRVISVGRAADGPLAALDAEHLCADPELVSRQMPPRPRRTSAPSEGPTLPGGPDGRIRVDDGELAWLESGADLLHSRSGLVAGSIDGVGVDFYRGRVITWFELSNDVDVPRPGPTSSLLRTVRRLLADRGTRRHRFEHSPGAGGTTVARRVAWELHDDHPVLVTRDAADPRALADRVRAISRLTDRQVLVLVENSTDAVTDAVYDQLRADSVPALLLLVGRRAAAPAAGATDHADRYLGPLNADERPAFVGLFGELAPSRRGALERAASRGADSSVPFLLALTAFQNDYTGLRDYVARGLAGARDDVREVLVAIAHRYAGTAVPANAFAPSLNVPRDAPVRLRNVLSGQADGLVIEERPGMWRTAHPLIAQEMLRQLLSPPGSGPAPSAGDSWRTSLAQRCINLIATLSEAYPQGLPDDERQLLERLFLARDHRGSFGGSRRTNAEVLDDVPAGEGRLEVLRVLAETFPDEPHYWAQYGRLLSYQSGDHPRARLALDRALELDDGDSVLWHMSGVVRRSELRGLLRAPSTRRPSRDPLAEAALQVQVRHAVSMALSDLARAAELDDASEYPHVTAARLCVEVIEWAKTRSTVSTYAEFLRRPAGQPYAELLDAAEDALDRLGEIIGDDTPSRYAEEAMAELRQIYDDYAGLLEGWRNVLARPDIIRAPVRRRIVRAYRNRAGGWRAAGAPQRRQAIALLDENLHDDPTDGRSVREWLRVARFTDASVDRAAELVSYWAEGDPSRDALFYQSVVYALLALEGRESALADYERAGQRCRDRSQSFPRRRTAYEWLGSGDGLGRLVHHTDLLDWERSKADAPEPALLARVTGRVVNIARAQSGLIEFGPGLTAFFTPSFSGLVAGRDENRLVTAFIGFAYDGPQAWSVQPADAER